MRVFFFLQKLVVYPVPSFKYFPDFIPLLDVAAVLQGKLSKSKVLSVDEISCRSMIDGSTTLLITPHFRHHKELSLVQILIFTMYSTLYLHL